MSHQVVWNWHWLSNHSTQSESLLLSIPLSQILLNNAVIWNDQKGKVVPWGLAKVNFHGWSTSRHNPGTPCHLGDSVRFPSERWYWHNVQCPSSFYLPCRGYVGVCDYPGTFWLVQSRWGIPVEATTFRQNQGRKDTKKTKHKRQEVVVIPKNNLILRRPD